MENDRHGEEIGNVRVMHVLCRCNRRTVSCNVILTIIIYGDLTFRNVNQLL